MPSTETDRAIYAAFLERAALRPEHRAELKRKRGFTDETIDTWRLVSGGPDNLSILNVLREAFDAEALVHAGVFRRVNEALVPENQLLDDRVIIPYLDETGSVTLLRPHKFGLAVPIQVYCRKLLKDRPEHVVLTEGEFKALALWQWGIPGIAIPGVSSFAGQHFDDLVELLKEFRVTRITIIYDNEDKSTPGLQGYKEKPEDRWDTPLWAYVMGYKLTQAGFRVLIGQLPNTWRVNGKIDFDGALAQGKTREDILAVIESALRPAAFVEALPDEAQPVVRRKIFMQFRTPPVRRELNRYIITRYRGEDKPPTEDEISNFTLDIRASYYGPDGCIRNVQLVNEFGEKSDVVPLDAEAMASADAFRRFALSHGNYLWDGSSRDLTTVWRYELLRETGQMIYQPDAIGEVRPGFWLFANVAIRDGKVHAPDDDGVFWIDGIGYKPQPLTFGMHGEAQMEAIPALRTEPISLDELADKLREATGGYAAWVALGWAIASLFSRPIFAEYKMFPFLFVHGKREAGKSTLVRWIMRLFGVDYDGMNLTETTQNFIMRALSYYSSLGIWFDEYRNEQRVTSKDGYLRSAYNRQLAGKGIKSAFGAISYKVRGALVITGEELPRDNGLLTRLIPVQVTEAERGQNSLTAFDWLNTHMDRFSSVTYATLLRYAKLEPRILSAIHEFKSELVKRSISHRTAENWAIPVATFMEVVREDGAFARWVLETCKEARAIAEEEHMLAQFWAGLEILESRGEIGPDHLRGDEQYIYLWFPALYGVWAESYRRQTGREPFDRASILKYIKAEPYYVKDATARVGGVTRKCLWLRRDAAPSPLLDTLDHMALRETRGSSWGTTTRERRDAA